MEDQIIEIQSFVNKLVFWVKKNFIPLIILGTVVFIYFSYALYTSFANKEERKIVSLVEQMIEPVKEAIAEETKTPIENFDLNTTKEAVKITGDKAVAYVTYTWKENGKEIKQIKVLDFSKDQNEWKYEKSEKISKENLDEKLLTDLCDSLQDGQKPKECDLVEKPKPEPEKTCKADIDCQDDLYCTLNDKCVNGSCQHTASPCEVGKICDEDKNTCVSCFFDSDCYDELFCTVNTCENNICKISYNKCPDKVCDETANQCQTIECQSSSDCSDDGLFCNGTAACQNNHCVSNINSPLCPSDGSYCNGDEFCDENTDKCGSQGDPCDASLKCNETKDTCAVCLSDADCPDDGNKCNGAESCDTGQGLCVSSGNLCPADKQCTSQGLCVDCLTINDCPDDSDLCTEKTCEDGVCENSYIDCPVSQICENGNCITQQCQSNADCSDSDACNGIEQCINNKCNQGTQLECGSSDPCKDTSCDQTKGCIFSDKCPADKQCTSQGLCVDCLTKNDCSDDSDLCTEKTCKADGTCENLYINCPDGKVCNQENGECEIHQCSTNDDCKDNDACDGIELCINSVCNEGAPIPCNDDGSECNGEESCDIISGLCVHSLTSCPDNKKCDNDQCVECLEDLDCSDNLFCNGVETCVNGTCQVNANPCSGKCDEINDKCVACLADNDCIDSDFCTINERCENNICRFDTHNCSDGKDCTGVEYCDPVQDKCISPGVNCELSGFVCIEGKGCVCNSNDDCDDNLFCNNPDECVDNVCNHSDTYPPCPPETPFCNEEKHCFYTCNQGDKSDAICKDAHSLTWKECVNEVMVDKLQTCTASGIGEVSFTNIPSGWLINVYITSTDTWVEYKKGESRILLWYYSIQKKSNLIGHEWDLDIILQDLKDNAVIDFVEPGGQQTIGSSHTPYQAAYIQNSVGSDKEIAFVATSCHINACQNWTDTYVKIIILKENSEVQGILNSLEIN